MFLSRQIYLFIIKNAHTYQKIQIFQEKPENFRLLFEKCTFLFLHDTIHNCFGITLIIRPGESGKQKNPGFIVK